MATKTIKKRLSAYRASLHHTDGASRYIRLYTLFVSLFLLLTSLIGALLTKEGDFFSHFLTLQTTPSPLITDYFRLGGLGSTFFNAGLLGLLVNLLMLLSKTEANATTLAAYFLVIAHGFYGLSLLSCLPILLGAWIYCLCRRVSFGEHLSFALFSTALGPFIGDFLFRYPPTHTGGVGLSVSGVLLSLVFGIGVGFAVPALIAGTSKMHRGYSLYKAGLAIGLLGVFCYALLYRCLGLLAPAAPNPPNSAYEALSYRYMLFCNLFLLALFLLTLLWGYLANKKSFDGFRALLRSTGYGTDFVDRFGFPVCLINLAVYGLCLLAFFDAVLLLPSLIPALPGAAGFTGPTLGVIFAALTFSADGQQIRTVWPIATGYALLFALCLGVCELLGWSIPWTLGSQVYLGGLAFATGLCPFAGKYGAKVGVAAGFLSASICCVTAAMHGGFILYNGGFTAGLAALLLLPILDFYGIEPRHEDDKI